MDDIISPYNISIHAPRTGSDKKSFSAYQHSRYFNPRSPHGERPPTTSGTLFGWRFQSTLPARGATAAGQFFQALSVFQSTLPARGATDIDNKLQVAFTFQSTLPARGATFSRACRRPVRQDFNPRSPHGERPSCGSIVQTATDFNPRSPHGERPSSRSRRSRMRYFNPRSPHGERRYRDATRTDEGDFNPRSPHGERPDAGKGRKRPNNFNPRSPHGERPPRGTNEAAERHFNPRSPHGERPPFDPPDESRSRFQSTLPARGATCVKGGEYAMLPSISIHAPRTGSDKSEEKRDEWVSEISIHAPRTGSDCESPCPRRCLLHFNPRSPHGERRSTAGAEITPTTFQSTLPARGATQRITRTTRKARFQSTLPARGATKLPNQAGRARQFQSTLPARGATPPKPRRFARTDISIHAPRTGSDCKGVVRAAQQANFNPRSPHGERRD